MEWFEVTLKHFGKIVRLKCIKTFSSGCLWYDFPSAVFPQILDCAVDGNIFPQTVLARAQEKYTEIEEIFLVCPASGSRDLLFRNSTRILQNPAKLNTVSSGSLLKTHANGKQAFLICQENSCLNRTQHEEKLASASPETKDAVDAARKGSAPKALMSMTIFPLMMLIAYIGIIMYFKNRGG